MFEDKDDQMKMKTVGCKKSEGNYKKEKVSLRVKQASSITLQSAKDDIGSKH